MSIQCERDGSTCLIRLAGAVGVDCSAETKQALVDVILPGNQVRLELDPSADLDITTIQLLLAAKREALARGTPFVLAGDVTGQFSAICSETGLDEFLLAVLGKTAPGGDERFQES